MASRFCADRGWPLRHRPAFQYAIEFQSKIVVQMRGGMFLDDNANFGPVARFLPAGSGVTAKLRLRRYSVNAIAMRRCKPCRHPATLVTNSA